MSGWAAAIGAGMDLANSALGLYSSSKAWRRQRESMQNQHQWEVEDLKKAGLNPILSATGSSVSGGFSSPYVSGSLGQSASAMESSSSVKEQAETARELSKSEIEKQRAEIELLAENKKSAVLNQSVLENQAAREFEQARLAGHQATSAAYAAELKSKELDYWNKHPNVFAGMMGSSVKGVSGALGMITEGLGCF